MSEEIRDGDRVEVTGGTHRGRSGIVSDRKSSKTGQITITVTDGAGGRFKTLARNTRHVASDV